MTKTKKATKRRKGQPASTAMLYRCPPIVWIVEMWVGYKGARGPWREGWAPTVGASIDSGIARLILREWKNKNPDDKFRLKKYRAV